MLITHEELLQLLHYDPETGWFTWKVIRNGSKIGVRAGHLQTNGYRRIVINGRKYLESRLAFFYMKGRWPDPEVDHKNRIPNDNRWDNLRESTRSQNNQNKTRKSTNKYKCLPIGVYHSGKKFRARANINGKFAHLGTFDTAEKASKAYCHFLEKTNMCRPKR